MSCLERLKVACERCPRGGSSGNNRRWTKRLGALHEAASAERRAAAAQAAQKLEEERMNRAGKKRCPHCKGWTDIRSSICQKCWGWL